MIVRASAAANITPANLPIFPLLLIISSSLHGLEAFTKYNPSFSVAPRFIQ
jgi:hypothetical protein